MVKMAYTPHLKGKDIIDFLSAAKHLRNVLHALDTSGTVWGHVWACHTPQFLVRSGTLYPFLCHGLEGRWRDLKFEIKLGTHGQWKTWSLIRLGLSINGLTKTVRKTNFFATFLQCMDDVQVAKRQHPCIP